MSEIAGEFVIFKQNSTLARQKISRLERETPAFIPPDPQSKIK